MNLNIGKYFGASVLSAALLLASAIPALAKETRAVNLFHPAVVKGTTLSAGHYLVRWETNNPRATVEFARGNKVIVSTEGRFEERGKKYDRDTVVYETAADGSVTINEIRFAGSSQALVLSR